MPVTHLYILTLLIIDLPASCSFSPSPPPPLHVLFLTSSSTPPPFLLLHPSPPFPSSFPSPLLPLLLFSLFQFTSSSSSPSSSSPSPHLLPLLPFPSSPFPPLLPLLSFPSSPSPPLLPLLPFSSPFPPLSFPSSSQASRCLTRVGSWSAQSHSHRCPPTFGMMTMASNTQRPTSRCSKVSLLCQISTSHSSQPKRLSLYLKINLTDQTVHVCHYSCAVSGSCAVSYSFQCSVGVWAHSDFCVISSTTGGIVMLGRR